MDRTFFVDNMIGDIFFGEKDVNSVIKEELTKEPYAGLFVFFLIERLDGLDADDFKIYEKALEGIYFFELKYMANENVARL